MNLLNLFADLAYGELSNLGMATELPGNIRDADKPKVTRYINDSLFKLYTRFCVKEKLVTIQQESHITYYYLTDRYAESNTLSVEPFKYIKDLAEEKFEEDVIKIMDVYDHKGNELPLNDKNHPNSLFTPQANLILQVPHPVGGMPLAVSYQARHPIVTLGAVEEQLEVPEVMHLALRAHVAYQVFSHMNTQEATAKAGEHMANYEKECHFLVEQDLVNTAQVATNTKFYKRGFV